MMGNTDSFGLGLKEQRQTDLFSNEASSSEQRQARGSVQLTSSKTSRKRINSHERKISTLALSQRQIVKGCMAKAKDDIAKKIHRRVIEKRDDFRKFVDALPEEERYELVNSLRNYLKTVANHLPDKAAVQRISEDFGAQHVRYRSFGFRPDFFAITADAVTTECVLLDTAMHPTSETLFAWSTLTSFMFSAVRDGYYNEQRRIRKTSQQHENHSRISLSSASNGTVNGIDNKRRNSSFSYKCYPDDMGEMKSSKSKREE